jgi:biopolymer transport protein ExbD
MAELNASPEKKQGNRLARRRTPARVDLTAMVDLAFLLITFFMMTTILSKPKAMPVAMPAGGPQGVVGESSTMTVCIGKNNQAVWYLGIADRPIIGPQQVKYGNQLTNAIIDIKNRVFKTSGKPLMVIVKPAEHSNYANLVETLDDLNINQVPSYAIAKIDAKDIDFLKQRGIY